jgi:hypothetical protein
MDRFRSSLLGPDLVIQASIWWCILTMGQLGARYVRSMQERITVYSAERGTTRADHELKL